MYPSEERFAKLLDKQKREWVRPKKRFTVDETTYQPDFYLPKENLYIEVVGTTAAYNYNKGKLIRFRKLYPLLNFVIVDSYNNPYPYGKNMPNPNIKNDVNISGKLVAFRVTKKEYERINELARKSIRTISNWLRKEVLEKLSKEKI